jgi:hypothetical protein
MDLIEGASLAIESPRGEVWHSDGLPIQAEEAWQDESLRLPRPVESFQE